MKAVVLAAGKGRRIRPVTEDKIPKPMVDLGQGPLLEHTLSSLTENDIDEIIINLHHKGEKIREYFKDDINGVSINYSEEDNLLGTAGGIKKIEEKLNNKFLLIYGDILTDLSLDKIINYHERKDSDLTIMVYDGENNLKESSIIEMDDDNKVQRFIEKPSKTQIEEADGPPFWTSAAIFVLEPKILDYIPEGSSDLSGDILPILIEENIDIYGFPKPNGTYWHEVGNPERYDKAVEDISEGRIEFKTL